MHAGVLALKLRHHVRGPRGDYLGLAGAALASWAGVPGPGEAALATAGVLASRNKLDIVSVVAVAWLGAAGGGIAGWLIGLKAGRRVVAGPGPLRRLRLLALDRGDHFFERFGALAVFFTPSWVAGVHGMRWTRYLPANAIAALTWALGVGLGSYLVGPSVTDVVDDVGTAGTVAVVALVVVAVAVALWRRSRRKRAAAPEAQVGSPPR